MYVVFRTCAPCTTWPKNGNWQQREALCRAPGSCRPPTLELGDGLLAMLSTVLAAGAGAEPRAMRALSAKTDAKPKAVVHVGPHKMGSTSLQELIFLPENIIILNQDKYEVPAHIGSTSYPPKAGADIAECYQGSPCSDPSCPSYLRNSTDFSGESDRVCSVAVQEAFDRFASQTAAHGRNLVLSSEHFDTAYDTAGLASTLDAFDTAIALSYRPLFDWMSSGAQLHLPFLADLTLTLTLTLTSTLKPALTCPPHPTPTRTQRVQP